MKVGNVDKKEAMRKKAQSNADKWKKKWEGARKPEKKELYETKMRMHQARADFNEAQIKLIRMSTAAKKGKAK